MRFNRKSRKGLFLSTTILRGVRLKDDNEGGGATGGSDDIEVGPGFAQAAAAQAGDDNRTPEQRGGATQDLDETGDDEGGDDESGEDEGGEEGDEQKTPPKKKNRETAAYIREIKRDAREAKATAAALAERLAVLEKGGLPNANAGGNSSDTSGAPDPTDEAKYPLGVLDDGYTADFIAWQVSQKVAEALGTIQQNAEASQAQRAEALEKAALAEKRDALIDQGNDLFEDFEEDVVETGLRGDWKLTQATFEAAAEAENGAAILHFLANNKAEAARVSEMTIYQQVKYVQNKDAEIAGTKPKPKKIPKAGAPPSDLPRGRNSSAPIRADTDNLDDFRKLFYKK